MVDIDVRGWIADLLEPGGEERGLSGRSVAGEEVEIPKRSQHRIRVQGGDVGPLEDDHLPVVCLLDAGEKNGSGQDCDCGPALLLDQILGNGQTLSAPAPGREQLQPVTTESGERGRAIHELVDRHPKRMVAGRSRPASRRGLHAQ